MQITYSIDQAPPLNPPIALTLGMFDSLHLGHQHQLNRLKHLGTSVLLTYPNHPRSLLKNEPMPLVLHPQMRLNLLKNYGIDCVILQPFTKEFAEQTPEEFLSHLHAHVPFSHLLLGYDTYIGKDRAANGERVGQIVTPWGAKIEVTDPLYFEGAILSTSLVRQAIVSGDLPLLERLLGRPYSLMGSIVKGDGLGKKIGAPTINISVDGLLLPPLGVYIVSIDGIPAIANLGHSPTMKGSKTPLLEVHLLEYEEIGDLPEVVLLKYLRPEIRFDNQEALIKQIGLDIASAKKFHQEKLGGR